MTTHDNEINFDHPFNNYIEPSEIQSFYCGSTVFLTGGTGFLGHLILEKLLRTCSEVKMIYILIREKRGKTPDERFKELFNDPVFGLLKKQQPNFLEKISAIIGDCVLPDLGIENQCLEVLKNEVNIVIHSAATVNFEEHLRKSVSININALKCLLKLSREMKNLKSFVHISTAYSNCTPGRKILEETFYKSPISGDELREFLDKHDDDFITEATPKLLNDWPNTYAMTKAIAEIEVLKYGKGLPIGIIRPSIVISTDQAPISGWINNIYGPTGLVAAASIGFSRCIRADPQETADLIPGDYVSDAVVACAWDVHHRWKENKRCNETTENKTKDSDEQMYTPTIYNFVSSKRNPISWGRFLSLGKHHEPFVTSTKAIWLPMLMLCESRISYKFMVFFVHILPGFIIDFLARFTQNAPPKMTEKYIKLHKFNEVIKYFSLQSWTFCDDNTVSMINRLSKRDKSLFNFDIATLDWNEYCRRYMAGIRTYIIKDPMETVPEGLKHRKKLYRNHYTLMAVLTVTLVMLLYGFVFFFINNVF